MIEPNNESLLQYDYIYSIYKTFVVLKPSDPFKPFKKKNDKNTHWIIRPNSRIFDMKLQKAKEDKWSWRKSKSDLVTHSQGV